MAFRKRKTPTIRRARLVPATSACRAIGSVRNHVTFIPAAMGGVGTDASMLLAVEETGRMQDDEPETF
jgi:hypothetical protein